MATMKAIQPHLPSTIANTNGLWKIYANQETAINFRPHRKTSSWSNRLAESLSHLLHLHVESPAQKTLHYTNENFKIEDKHNTSVMSPKKDMSEKWREIQGGYEWDNLLDPLHPWLRREIVKYGEFVQATYDAFDFDSFSEYCGSCRYNENKLFDKLGLNKHGYKRGTVSPSEWYENFQRKLDSIGHGEAKVEHGVLSIYKSKSESTRYNKSSASEQVMKEVKRLVQFYNARGEEVSLTIIGHSLGGALALLTAYEVASSLSGLHVNVISFAKQDLVPRMPGLVFNESLQKFDDITGTLDWVYTHVGDELKLVVWFSPYLKRGFNVSGFHMLETYLHLVDGFHSKDLTFRSDARRDVALVNKTCDMLVDELRIPHFWYQQANKGLECNEHGRRVKPKRDPEDIPTNRAKRYSRGTVSPSEWYEDFQRKLDSIGHGEAKVEHGFLSIYKSKSESTGYNKSSASEQVMKEVKRLVQFYNARGEEVSLTIIGHSLGGALALLTAYEVASSLSGLHVNVISFAKQDLVPRMPGLVFNESLQKFDDITGTLDWVYTHVGVELKLVVWFSPYLKRGFNVSGFHMLETYLHLVDGFHSKDLTFRSDARRDVALVNKTCDMLVDELRIPHFWYQQANKGLECNEHGRRVKPKRDPEDIPVPISETHTHIFEMQENCGLIPLLSL
ncbi:unnamed protein product [Ilex paraguariensis]|uniref:Fungal lipase-type domain-containing protein n=1 Tax=Ilex paraguariensis TaxID=185542 RepID=A0ABC8T7K2_9AQUA